MKISFRVLISAASLLTVLPAVAADYEPPIVIDEPVEEVPVEIGSGWYLRGDVGYAFNTGYDYSTTPDGLTTEDRPWSGSIGMGYHFTDYLRAELDLGILPTTKFDNQFTTLCGGDETTTVVDNFTGLITSQTSGPAIRPCEGTDEGDNDAYNLMAKGFVDLGTYVGITPYVGGGLGVTYSSYSLTQGQRNCLNDSVTTIGGGSTVTTSFNCFDPSVYRGTETSEKQYNVTYSLGAGLAYQISQYAQLDLGYEYVSVPGAKFVSVDAAGAPFVAEGVDFHSVKLGLRYDLW